MFLWHCCEKKRNQICENSELGKKYYSDREISKSKKNDKDELEEKTFLQRKEPITEKSNFNVPDCPSCKQHNWVIYTQGYYCPNSEVFNIKQKNQIGKKKYLDKTRVFLLEYLMQLKRLEKQKILWWKVRLIHQITWLVNYKVESLKLRSNFIRD